MTTPATTSIIYPETDGMPLPDGEYQAPLYVRIVGTLRTHFRDIPGARVNGDTFIYYVEGVRVSVLLSRSVRSNPICCGKWASRPTSSWR